MESSASGSSDEVRFKRILVPTDFSEGAEHALEYAICLSGFYHAEIVLLHVFDLPEYLSLLSEKAGLDSEAPERVLEAAKKRAVEKLQDIVRPLADKEPVIIIFLAIGVPFEEIVRVAAEWDVELIVMSTHGRTGLAHFLLGSITERVVSHAACPVLVVNQKKDKAGPPHRARSTHQNWSCAPRR